MANVRAMGRGKLFCDGSSNLGNYTYILNRGSVVPCEWSLPHYLVWVALATYWIFLLVWARKLDTCCCLLLLLPPPVFSLFTHPFLESGLRFSLSLCFHFFTCFLPASLHPLLSSLPPLLSSVPFVWVPFILKSVLELTPACLFPAALNWQFGKRRLQFP